MGPSEGQKGAQIPNCDVLLRGDKIGLRAKNCFNVVGVAWDRETDIALATLNDWEQNKFYFLKISDFTTQSKIETRVVAEVQSSSIYYRTSQLLSRKFIDFIPEHKKDIFIDFFKNEKNGKNQPERALEKAIEVHSTAGGLQSLKSGIVFSRSFKSLVKKIMFDGFDNRHLEGVQEAFSVGCDQNLQLLATGYSVYLYSSLKGDIHWEMPFRFEMVDGLMAEARIAKIENGRNLLRFFGVNESQNLGLLKTIDLSCFEKIEGDNENNKGFDYFRLLDFVYLPKSSHYLAIVQQVYLKVFPNPPKSAEEEEIVIFKDFMERSPPGSENPSHQKIHVIKLSNTMEMVQKSTLKYETNERLKTAVKGGQLLVLRGHLAEITVALRKQSTSRLTLEIIDLDGQNHQKGLNRRVVASFDFETKNSISRFIYSDSGHLALILSRFENSSIGDPEDFNFKELRNDRFLLKKNHPNVKNNYRERYQSVYILDLNRPGGQESQDQASNGSKIRVIYFHNFRKRNGRDIWRLKLDRTHSDLSTMYLMPLKRSDQQKDSDLVFKRFNQNLNNFEQKELKDYFRPTLEHGESKADYSTVSDFYPADENGLIILEYLTKRPYKRTRNYTNSSDKGTLFNSQYEKARERMFRLAYLDLKTGEIRRFRVEAEDLILNRLLVWERGGEGQQISPKEPKNDNKNTGAGRVILADFDESMNLVLIDLNSVMSRRAS